jgi:hypothetical protein
MHSGQEINTPVGLAWHPSTEVNKTKLERVHKRALHFVYGRHIPEQNKTQLLNVDQQFRYNDLTFFRKCLDEDTDMDAMARITTGRIVRNSNCEHRLIPQERALTSVSTRSLSGSQPSGIPSLSASSQKNWHLLPISLAMSFSELLTSSVCPFSPSM